MTAIEAWITAHQMLLLILWPTVTALASLVYKALDADTRAHAVFSFLASIGVDIPKIIDAVGRMITPPNSPPKPPSPPAGLAVFAMFLLSATTVIGIGGVTITTTSCTPAQQALEAKIEQTVLADLAAGKTRQQIEVDIGTLVAGQTGADIALIVDDAIIVLIDIGVIPPNLLPKTVGMLPAEKRAKLHLPQRYLVAP
jgi:hypothetical protein